MITKIKDIIIADSFRYTGKKGLSSLLKSLKIPGFKYTFCLRKVQFFKEQSTLFSKVPLLFWGILLRKYRYMFGFDIPANTKIGPGFYLGHFGQIVINSNAVIGSNVNISPGVTIGATRASTILSSPGVPTIGNRVWIGTNAVIVGNVTVGDDALIAPGAYVYFDVPPFSIVRGNPGKILPTDIGSKGYVNRIVE